MSTKNENFQNHTEPEDAMTPQPVEDKYCGARTRSGGFCKRPAGWGTGRRYGRCKLHGGGLQTHGAFAVRTTDPASQALADHLWSVLEGEPQAILRQADRPALESVAVLIRQRQRLAEWLEEHGPVDERGQVRPAVEALIKLSRALLEHANALGMTPAARAKLGLDVARTASIADEFARLHGRNR